MVQHSAWSTELDIDRVIDTYGNMLFRICLVFLCNEQDADGNSEQQNIVVNQESNSISLLLK